MAGVLDDRMRLFRFYLLFISLERVFLKLCSFTSVVKRYVCGEKEQIVLDGKRKRLDNNNYTAKPKYNNTFPANIVPVLNFTPFIAKPFF